MVDMLRTHAFDAAQAGAGAGAASPLAPIGIVAEIAGAGSRVTFDRAALNALADHADPAIATGGQVGGLVRTRVGHRWLIASVRTLRLTEDGHADISAQVDFLGEGEQGADGGIVGFRRGVTRYPTPSGEVFPVSTDDLRQIYSTDERANVKIGTVYPTKDIQGALYVDAMLGKHFALLGSTGTGKSTAAALILHRICQASPHGHILMIDPHGEYARAFADNGAIFDVGNLAMPYWLMNFEEHCEVFLTSSGSQREVDADILAKCLLAARGKNRLASEGRVTVDSPIPYLLSDLTNMIQQEMGKMDRAGDTGPYLRLKAKIEEVKGDPRFAFMFSGMLVADTMGAFLQRMFRLPTDGRPISIIDVSGVPSEITTVVVAVLSRLVFDFAIWSRGEQVRPILLVCEEAHRYIPSERDSSGSSVARILGRIAKEGRKYGVSLGLITQRPSDLAEGVLSQCGTIITMRLNNDRDQAFVRAAMPEGARGFLEAIPALRNRECIISGEGVATPIRVLFDDLEAERRPASADPSFSELWQQGGGEADALDRTIRRWRSQRH